MARTCSWTNGGTHPPDLALVGDGSMRSRAEEFRVSRQTTSTANHEAEGEADRTYQGLRSPHDTAQFVYPDFGADDLFVTTHEEFVALVHKVPLAKAGGEDGVLGEILLALSPQQQAWLFESVKRVLPGVSPIPSSWTQATVTLIPKILAGVPRDYRPITVLLVAQNLALKSMAC